MYIPILTVCARIFAAGFPVLFVLLIKNLYGQDTAVDLAIGINIAAYCSVFYFGGVSTAMRDARCAVGQALIQARATHLRLAFFQSLGAAVYSVGALHSFEFLFGPISNFSSVRSWLVAFSSLHIAAIFANLVSGWYFALDRFEAGNLIPIAIRGVPLLATVAGFMLGANQRQAYLPFVSSIVLLGAFFLAKSLRSSSFKYILKAAATNRLDGRTKLENATYGFWAILTLFSTTVPITAVSFYDKSNAVAATLSFSLAGAISVCLTSFLVPRLNTLSDNRGNHSVLKAHVFSAVKFSLALAGIAALVVYLTKPWLSHLLGKENVGGFVSTIFIVLAAHGLRNCGLATGQCAVLCRREAILTPAAVWETLTTLSLLFLFTPTMGAVGAAYAILVGGLLRLAFAFLYEYPKIRDVWGETVR